MESLATVTARPRILVVDDEPSLRKLVSIAMVMNDWDADAAGDGEEALAILDRESPDLVILDVMMPGDSGYQVCRDIRERDEQLDRHTPVILLTARNLSADPEREAMIIASAGADAMLYKPMDMDILVEKVRALLPPDLDITEGSFVVVDPDDE